MNKDTEEQTGSRYSMIKKIGIWTAIGAAYMGILLGKEAVYDAGLAAGIEKTAINSIEASDLNKDGLEDLVITQKDGKKIAQIQGASGQYSSLKEHIASCISQDVNAYARNSVSNKEYVAQRAYAPKTSEESEKAMRALEEVTKQAEQEAYALQKTIEDRLK